MVQILYPTVGTNNLPYFTSFINSEESLVSRLWGHQISNEVIQNNCQKSSNISVLLKLLEK